MERRQLVKGRWSEVSKKMIKIYSITQKGINHLARRATEAASLDANLGYEEQQATT